MKIVINNCYGGFGLSKEAKKELDMENVYDGDIHRDDPKLVDLVERHQKDRKLYRVSSDFGSLKVVEIPDGVEWQIEEYDGLEWVAEKHSTWH